MKGGKSSSNLDDIQLIWPTVDQVGSSLEGWSAGLSLCADSKNMTKSFLSKWMYKWQEEQNLQRQNAMPHMKSFGCVTKDGQLPYLVIGSHNLSKAAWGEIQKTEKFFIRHWEMGVYITGVQCLNSFSCTPTHPKLGVAFTRASSSKTMLTTWNSKLPSALKCPLPFTLPSVPYDRNDRPWVWDKPVFKPDRFGRQFPRNF